MDLRWICTRFDVLSEKSQEPYRRATWARDLTDERMVRHEHPRTGPPWHPTTYVPALGFTKTARVTRQAVSTRTGPGAAHTRATGRGADQGKLLFDGTVEVGLQRYERVMAGAPPEVRADARTSPATGIAEAVAHVDGESRVKSSVQPTSRMR